MPVRHSWRRRCRPARRTIGASASGWCTARPSTSTATRRNFPVARGSAAARGLDYLAIGDTHGFREVEPDAPAPTVYPGAPEATNFGERDTGNVAIAFFPLDRRRRAIVRSEAVGSWAWRDVTCHSMPELRALAAEPNLRKTVLRLRLDVAVPMAEYDEAERLVGELGGSMAATPRVGVLLWTAPPCALPRRVRSRSARSCRRCCCRPRSASRTAPRASRSGSSGPCITCTGWLGGRIERPPCGSSASR